MFTNGFILICRMTFHSWMCTLQLWKILHFSLSYIFANFCKFLQIFLNFLRKFRNRPFCIIIWNMLLLVQQKEQTSRRDNVRSWTFLGFMDRSSWACGRDKFSLHLLELKEQVPGKQIEVSHCYCCCWCCCCCCCSGRRPREVYRSCSWQY